MRGKRVVYFTDIKNIDFKDIDPKINKINKEAIIE